MEEIKREFTEFIKNLILSYPKLQPAPNNLALIGKQSREFNGKVQAKIDELIANNPELEPMAIKIEFAPIRAAYRI